MYNLDAPLIISFPHFFIISTFSIKNRTRQIHFVISFVNRKRKKFLTVALCFFDEKNTQKIRENGFPVVQNSCECMYKCMYKHWQLSVIPNTHLPPGILISAIRRSRCPLLDATSGALFEKFFSVTGELKINYITGISIFQITKIKSSDIQL